MFIGTMPKNIYEIAGFLSKIGESAQRWQGLCTGNTGGDYLYRVFRDPVHDLISFHKTNEQLPIRLIDTPEMQRLRRIRQLGLSYFTYGGAEHSRFTHSLGTAHLMKTMLDRLEELSKRPCVPSELKNVGNYRLLAVCAALLHDIGHGPFSHALERITRKKHEEWTRDIILDPNTEINKELKEYDSRFPQKVANIISRIFVPQYVVKLLSSQLDVDRFDYLLRDSLMTGTDYGRFDINWLIRSIQVGMVQDQLEIGLDKRKGKTVAEDFVLARRSMYINVYYHKTTRGAEVLVEKIFKRAAEVVSEIEGTPVIKKLLSGQDLTVSEYLSLDEHVILFHIHQWQNSTDAILSDLCNRLLTRKLFKCLNITGINTASMEYIERIVNLRTICDNKGLPHNYYLASDEAPHSAYKDYYIVNKPKEKEGTTEYKEASEQIYLFDEHGNGEELANASDLISAVRNKRVSIVRLYYPAEIRSEVERLFQ